MKTLKAVLAPIAIIAVAGLVGCGTVARGQTRAHSAAHLKTSGESHPANNVALSKGARQFMSKVPIGDTGYPAIGLVLGSVPGHAQLRPAKAAEVVGLFKRLRAAQALLGSQLASPQVSYEMITDYNPQFRHMRVGAKFPAVVLTYPGSTCESLGPPRGRGPLQVKCTTIAFYDLKNSHWLGIYQYTHANLSAIKKI